MSDKKLYEDKSKVKVYYAECGICIERASHPDLFISSNKAGRATRKEFKQAVQWGRKVEIISYEDFQTKTVYCNCSSKTL